MKQSLLICLLMTALTINACAQQQQPQSVVWNAENYPEILQLLGSPYIISTPCGQAVSFNGETDGVFVNGTAVAGMEELTLEVIFRQNGEGKFEERFLHMGQLNGARIMFETRVNPDKTWYFDAHINYGNRVSATLIYPELTHPTDMWYNVALVCDKNGMTTYVNGVEQGHVDMAWQPGIIGDGVTSIGVRQNLVNYFKGEILKLRATPKALKPEEFLKDYEILNKK